MMLLPWMFDGLLAAILLWVAWMALTTPDLFKAIVFFIAYGLLTALAWVRLHAPDIAMAEAAIGAGLTGALFLATLGQMERLPGGDQAGRDTAASRVRSRWLRWRLLAGQGMVFLFSVAVSVAVGWAVWTLPEVAPGLRGPVLERLGESGVEHPVTAVLLNFRSYDTLLEIGVLLVAVVGARGLIVALPPRPPHQLAGGPVLTGFVRLLIPLMMVAAGYILWRGTKEPGGAFQGGAILAGAGVLLLLSDMKLSARLDGWPLRTLMTLGFALFLIVAVGVMIPGRDLLQYPSPWAGRLILLIEAASAISIGCILAALFAGGWPARSTRTATDKTLEDPR